MTAADDCARRAGHYADRLAGLDPGQEAAAAGHARRAKEAALLADDAETYNDHVGAEIYFANARQAEVLLRRSYAEARLVRLLCRTEVRGEQVTRSTGTGPSRVTRSEEALDATGHPDSGRE